MYTLSLQHSQKIRIFFKVWPMGYPENPVIETSATSWVDIPQGIKDQIAGILDGNEAKKDTLTRLFAEMKNTEVLAKPEMFRKVLLALYEQRDKKLESIDPRKRMSLLKEFTATVTRLSLQHANAMHQSKYKLAITWLHSTYTEQERSKIAAIKPYLEAHRSSITWI